MDQQETVATIGDALTQLDTRLMSGDPPSQSAQWQQLFAQRKHLDDQQRQLVQQQVSADDAEFKAAADMIALAAKQLQQEVDAETQVDAIIKTVSQISASVDQILKLA